MKKVGKGVEPPKLLGYRGMHSTASWDQFLKRKSRKLQVRKQLLEDQGGLCAYCEIDLKPASCGGSVEDLRVEHFHPKSDLSTTRNWALDWQNLLACCHGGSQRNVVDAAKRFTSPDSSCDIPKADNNWDSVIINPLQLPAFPCLFKYDRTTGGIGIDSSACHRTSICSVKVQDTIDKLCLDGDRLRRLRKPILDHVNHQIRSLVNSGCSVEDARSHIAKALLCKNSDNHWPAFFSAIRSYLGAEAEKQLLAITYDG